MTDCRLDKGDLAKLRVAHREVRDVREAYRINAVILWVRVARWRTLPMPCCLIPTPSEVNSSTTTESGVDGLLRMAYVGSEAIDDYQFWMSLDTVRPRESLINSEAAGWGLTKSRRCKTRNDQERN